MSVEFYWIAVAVTTVLSASRVTRLFTWDDFPPTKALREWYGKTAGDAWGLLLFCGYCFSFWATGLIVTFGLLAGVYDSTPAGYDSEGFAAWWIINGILGGSYAAAVFMSRDGDDD